MAFVGAIPNSTNSRAAIVPLFQPAAAMDEYVVAVAENRAQFSTGSFRRMFSCTCLYDV
jgi:hypothetical protein